MTNSGLFSDFETKTMLSLIEMASVQRGKTLPNPMTAAAVISDNTVISIGVHQKAGEDHAEVVALNDAGNKAKGATLLVNLEPCTHTGRTPPCTEAIIKAGIARVIFSMKDPNPMVQAKPAREILEREGVQVDEGLCLTEALKLNEVFIKNQKTKMPFVLLKAGMSLDGKIALKSGQSKYITGEASLKKVHHFRRDCDAILVGINTVLEDDPLLNIRFDLMEEGYCLPKKIVLDPHGKCPINSRLISDDSANVLLITTEQGKKVFQKQNQNQNQNQNLPMHVTIIKCDTQDSGFNWDNLLKLLYQEGVHHLLIEGGQHVYTSAIEANIVDKYAIFIAPKLLGGRDSFTLFSGEGVANLALAHHLKDVQVTQLGNDVLIEGYSKKEN